MKNAPNSKTNLDRALQRFAGGYVRANELRVIMANAIVAQMIGNGVVKGGSGLKFRYGEKATRVTQDLDTAWRESLGSFLKDLSAKLKTGWHDFTGEVLVMKQCAPRGIPFDYVMQPCDIKLKYKDSPWCTVLLEIGHNEIGDADAYDLIDVPNEVGELFDFLVLPRPEKIPAMKLEFQIAQKLHGATEPNSKRAHDLIDLQLIFSRNEIDFKRTKDICYQLFYYRRRQSWPAQVVKNENWDKVYNDQRGELSVLPTVDEAIEWANELIAKIDAAE